MIKYSIKDGFKVNKKYAQSAGEIMRELEAENRLTAKELVDVSRPDDAPLHDYFEWDNEIAAEKFREEQGRYLIRAIAEVEEPDDMPDTVELTVVTKSFYSIGTNDENYYHINTIVREKDKAQQLLETAIRELRQFERRYEIIRDKLTGVFEAIDRLEA